MDNWIGIREKTTGTIKPLLNYRPGESVTITLLHPARQREQQPIQIDFFYAPPHSVRKTRDHNHAAKRVTARALRVGSILVDHDSLGTNPTEQDEQLELSLSVDKACHLHAVLKKTHAPVPAFPFIISQVQFNRCKLRSRELANRPHPTILTTDKQKSIELALRRANTPGKRFSLAKLMLGLCFGLLGLLAFCMVSSIVFPDLDIPFFSALFYP